MKKQLLTLLVCFVFGQVIAQSGDYWAPHKGGAGKIVTAKGVERQSFPKTFQLFDLNFNPLRQILMSNQVLVSKQTVVISLPNAKGELEQFEMYEASNFEPELQARFPDIRAYSGKGITDPYATLKLSISPQGVQTMVFRTDKENEFMEQYSQDGKTYAVYQSTRNKGALPFSCTTEETQLVKSVDNQLDGRVAMSNDRKLRTMRLAQSVTAEYSAYYGWTTSTGNIGLVVTAVNNTMTRCNGVYEKDLGLHLNLIAATTNVFFNDPATDGYTDGDDTGYNADLQSNLTNIIGDANYDIGHLFSAVGNNGNAGCIGCVCDAGKGSGFTTSTAPIGDNFDIDFVVHEVGHQLGANHTFTMSGERSGNNMEPGSGVTIMGYAGITNQDIDNHSIDTFHATSISQMQINLASKTCPVVTDVPNVAPTVAAGADYVIPINTPFILEGSATDPNGALTYQWEQFDHDTANQTAASSDADPAKTIGPNWQSWPPTSVGYRYMPRVQSIIANAATTLATVNGGDAGILTEALSSVSRTLNFRLTVRDNVPFVAGSNVGQTNFDDKVVTVSNTSGPFAVSVPSNAGLSYVAGSNQTVTWSVASTNTGAVNCQFVDIYLFTDNTLTNGILLASKVPNDGSETVTIPNNAGTTHRIMVRGNNNIFFDISNNNFTITAPASSFAASFNGVAGEQNKGACQGTNTIVYTFDYSAMGSFAATTNFTATGVPANTTVTFSPTSRTTDGPVTMTVNTTSSTPVGIANIIVNATSGATTKTVPFYLEVASAPAAATLTAPANNATLQNVNLSLAWTAGGGSTGYDIQVATDNAFANIIAVGSSTTTSYLINGLTEGTDYYWRVRPTTTNCSGSYGTAFKFTTGRVNCSTVSNSTPVTLIPIGGNNTRTSTITIPSGMNINDLNLGVNINHTAISDLRITLSGPTGASAVVLNGSCADNDNINATFDDSGAALVCGTSPAVSGTVIPLNALSVFNGTNSAGTWTLTIKDSANGNGGALNSWSLNICNILAPLSTQDFEFADFSLSPNPSNGNFNVKFTTTLSNDIKINVHDMRGRQVYEKSFTSNGTFNQDINLNNVEAGIYLVSISEGSKKTVRKIIVE